MPTIAESVGPEANQLAASLAAGLDVISQNQTVTFTPYVKLILPLDGFVFWVKASLLSPSGLLGVTPLNTLPLNKLGGTSKASPQLFVAPGSLHITTTNQQDPDESFSVNRVVFTSKVPVNDLNEVSPTMMYLAEHGDFRYAFSQRRSFYRQADLYHYVGDAVYPVMESQIIDSLAGFDNKSLIVSNSLPIWLGLNRFMPMYPSFLVSDNIEPPYAAVHIPEDATEAIQATPFLDKQSNHWQLVKDRVRITMYGLRNAAALEFQDYVINASLYGAYPPLFGVMDTPVIRDVKRTQTEISAVAQKKSFVITISYYQQSIVDLARQFILNAVPNVIIAN